MNSLSRYVIRQVGGVLLFVTLGLTLAIWLSSSLRFVDLIVNKGVAISMFGYLAMLLLPRFLTIVLPIALFSAVVFTYYKLVGDSELVVMRAVGLSQAALARPALYVAFGVTAIMYALTLYFLPVSYRAFKNLYADIRNEFYNLVLQEGTFQDLSEGVTVYIRERRKSGELAGILVHDAREPDQEVTYMAESGALVGTDDGPRVVLLKGNRQTMEKDTQRLSLLYFDRYTVEIDLRRADTSARWHEPRERFVDELFFPDDSPADRAYRKQIKAEAHQRVIAPLYCLTFTLIALASILYGDFDRRGQWRRVLLSVILVVAVQAAGLALNNLAAKTSAAVPPMYLMAVLPMLVAIFVLGWRPRQRKRLLVPAQALGPA